MGCYVPCDKLADEGSITHLSKAPLLEIAVNRNCASGFENRACPANQGGKAGVGPFGKAGLGLSARQESPGSCRTGSKHASKHTPCTGKGFHIANGGSTHSSIEHQARDLPHGHNMRQLQGREVDSVSEPGVLPKHGRRVSTYDAGQHQHAEVDSSRKQAAAAGQQAKASFNGSSSTSDRRKALMKALVRTTPTRAPSVPVEATQSSSSGAGHRPSSQPQCEGIATEHSQSSSSLGAVSAQSRLLPLSESDGIGGPVLLTSGLQGKPKSGWGDPSIARSCKALIGNESAVGQSQDAQHARSVTKEAVDASLGSGGTRAVRRSLLLQPGFC
ncbi:hypothetical protein ABBQ38_011587 [Trebouxia sp. C0009 RCD-2024]